jgi:hypothetical protein
VSFPLYFLRVFLVSANLVFEYEQSLISSHIGASALILAKRIKMKSIKIYNLWPLAALASAKIGSCLDPRLARKAHTIHYVTPFPDFSIFSSLHTFLAFFFYKIGVYNPDLALSGHSRGNLILEEAHTNNKIGARFFHYGLRVARGSRRDPISRQSLEASFGRESMGLDPILLQGSNPFHTFSTILFSEIFFFHLL